MRRAASGRCCSRLAKRRNCRARKLACSCLRGLTSSSASTRAATHGDSIEDDELYRTRELPEGLRYRLWLDGREVVLKLQTPDRSDEDASKK